MRIGIVGAGGVGGYFGARLAQAGEEVFFIARGPHLAAMQQHGLRLESPKGAFHMPRVNATSDPSEVDVVDVVFSTVKMYDAASAVPLIRPMVGPQTIVIPLQNGVDAREALLQGFPARQVAGGTAHVTALIAEPGLIRHTALDCLVFGMPGNTPSPPLEALRAAGLRAGFDAVLSDRIEVEVWLKFIRLTVFSGMTAICRSSIGPIRDDRDLRAMMESAWHESIAVARAKGIALPSTILEDLRSSIGLLPPQTRSSMLEDLERGRRLELPWLSGAMVRIADQLSIDAPTHRLFVTLLRLHANGRATL